MVVIYFGSFSIIVGLFGTVMQAFILMADRYYRQTPCTFYFIVAAIHEFGIFTTAYGQLVASALIRTDLGQLSIVWCKLRYFFITSCCAMSSSCLCMATIDQFFITSQNARIRQLSSIKNAYRVCLSFAIIWWLQGTLWIYSQNISPITGVCVRRSYNFAFYGIFFSCVVLCGLPCLIMTIFGLLAYRNIGKTIFLSRLGIDRQLVIVVFIQVVLTLVGLAPYGINRVFLLITLNFQKTADEEVKETLANNITYLFSAVAYGGRFYLLMCSSSRFRRMVKNLWLCGQRQGRIVPTI
ncbi:unnamed protein product [Rotaria socialis]|uniref:G-protein coupled receptors family 1 profile domain-containing protein n=1 Tax=Rotaria socialis TaxID=392032 RepID=A0A818Q5I7_9BILA|nr:unnamed protein product [Rotaria socialis]CAF4796272.1 unnamed protein product [Rotaria socialis]